MGGQNIQYLGRAFLTGDGQGLVFQDTGDSPAASITLDNQGTTNDLNIYDLNGNINIKTTDTKLIVSSGGNVAINQTGLAGNPTLSLFNKEGAEAQIYKKSTATGGELVIANGVQAVHINSQVVNQIDQINGGKCATNVASTAGYTNVSMLPETSLGDIPDAYNMRLGHDDHPQLTISYDTTNPANITSALVAPNGRTFMGDPFNFVNNTVLEVNDNAREINLNTGNNINLNSGTINLNTPNGASYINSASNTVDVRNTASILTVTIACPMVFFERTSGNFIDGSNPPPAPFYMSQRWTNTFTGSLIGLNGSSQYCSAPYTEVSIQMVLSSVFLNDRFQFMPLLFNANTGTPNFPKNLSFNYGPLYTFDGREYITQGIKNVISGNYNVVVEMTAIYDNSVINDDDQLQLQMYAISGGIATSVDNVDTTIRVRPLRNFV